MAAPTPAVCTPALSQKQRRAALRKERRKRKRQALAQARDCGSKNGVSQTPEEDINEDDGDDEDVAEEEKLRLHEEWLERERLAQEEFRLRTEREEAARKRKEEEERMIKEEWEAQQKKEEKEKEQRQQDKRDREKHPSNSSTKIHTKRKPTSSSFSSHMDEAVQKMLDEAENQLENGAPWMNPEAPATKNSENFGTERDVANCPFFLKTGACRFGDRCSRKHVYPTTSPTLMIRGMFTTFGMEQSRRDDYDIDACLEHSEEELQESFLDFYHDVLPELKSVGKVVQFKVSCNYEPHLRGNVYIQFDTEEQCKEAIIKFNGRWYAGRQLHCELCPVTRWKNAICGLFDRQKCPKGKHCNFLHVFRNPGNEFWEADRDLHMSPDRSVRGSRRDGWHSERYGDRSWRQRQRSRSPLRSERSHSRREDSRREDSRREDSRRRSRSRDRSRERRSSHQHREDKRSSRHSDRRKDWSLRRSRSRSRSRDREQDRPSRRSRDEDREHRSRNRSEEKDGKAREQSRSPSRERKKESRERSPKCADKKEKPPNDDGKRRRHKQSKKSKKKSKKKHKKKSHSAEGEVTSGESERESEGDVVENLAAEEMTEGRNDLAQSPRVDSKTSEQSEAEIPSESAGKSDTTTS